jgi:hypothetical protein
LIFHIDDRNEQIVVGEIVSCIERGAQNRIQE